MTKLQWIYKASCIAAIVILILNIFDLGTTFYALANGATELNPISKWLIETKLLIPFKLGACGAILYGAFKVHKPFGKALFGLCALWWIAGIYSLTIVLNFVTILRAT